MTQPKPPPHIQQNGTPIFAGGPGGGAGAPQPTLRHQFRRQGSSFGGGVVHPMAVMVASPNRVDYSVTKGGLRVWAVLFIFIFLCSSLYTVFSAREIAELTVDIDGDGDIDLDHEVDEDADEVANQHRKVDRDTHPSRQHAAAAHAAHDGSRRVHSPPKVVVETADEESEPAFFSDDDNESQLPTEESLFASLRAKVEQKFRQLTSGEKRELEEEDDGKVYLRQKKSRERKKRGSREAADDDGDDNVVDEQQVPKHSRKPKPKDPAAKEKRVNEKIEAADDEEEEVIQPVRRQKGRKPQKKNEKEEDTEDEDEEEKLQEMTKPVVNNKSRKKAKIVKREVESKKKNTVDLDEDEATTQEEKGEDDDDVMVTIQSPSKKRTEEEADEQQDRPVPVCRKGHCEPNIEPRKSILKRKPPPHGQKRYEIIASNPDGESEEEDEDDEDDQVVEEVKRPIVTEMASVVKIRPSGRAAYKRHGITNRDDFRYRMELDRADLLVEQHDYETAFAIFDSVLAYIPDSARAHFGRARALDIRSEAESSNAMLDEAITEYQLTLDNDETPDALFRQAADRLVNRARFRGSLHRALRAHRMRIDRFPDDLDAQNEFGLTFLMMGRNEEAKAIFQNVLQSDPNNGYAAAYYGLILKSFNGELEQSVQLMRRGIRSKTQELADARLYYQLGDGLMRLGKASEAYKVYEEAANLGLFLSKYQRSLNNVKDLTGRPWWTMDQTTYSRYLRRIERQWLVIRQEALAALADAGDRFVADAKKLTAGSEYSALHLRIGDEFVDENCDLMPTTCDLLEEFTQEANATKGQMKLSLLRGGTRVWPHCGPTNSRLQAHLGLVVPSEARIRVGDRTRGWKTGRFIIFDDSFEHELWFDGASAVNIRLVLVLDLWHPEVPPLQRREWARKR